MKSGNQYARKLASALADLHPKQILLAGVAGTITGILTVSFTLSFSALIFTGPLNPYVFVGVGNILVGAVIFAVAFSFFSSLPAVLAEPQGMPATAMAAVSAAIVGALVVETANPNPATASSELVATVVVAMGLASLLTGVVFYLFGHLKIGGFARFLPVTVLNGFLAGLGWLIVAGGIGVMAGISVSLLTLSDIFRFPIIVLWLPGTIFGVATMLLRQRWRHFLMLPGLLLLGVILFYLFLSMSGVTIDEARSLGLLFERWPGERLWQPVDYTMLQHVDWRVIAGQAPSIMVVTIVSLLGILVNASVLELATGRDADLNQELRTGGIANILTGLFGGLAGYPSASKSLLGYEMGVHSRMLGIFSAAICALALFLDPNILTYFPKPVLGGLLVYLGLSILQRAFFLQSLFSRLDYALILVILLTSAIFGLLQGVVVGILIATLIFLIDYSQTNVVRHSLTRSDYAGAVERAPLYEQLLEQRGQCMEILTLQGYIFFGTAYRLIEELKARLNQPDLPPLRYLVIDTHLVTGVDTSAALSFVRLKQATDAANVKVVLTGLAPAVRRMLEVSLLGDGDDNDSPSWRLMPTMDEGVAWCEEQMITTFADVGIRAAHSSVIAAMAKLLSRPADEVDWLDYLRPNTGPEESSDLVAFMDYLEPFYFQSGDLLLVQSEPVDGFYFLEEGRAVFSTTDEDGMEINTGILDAGTNFGVNAFYAEQSAPFSVRATSVGVIQHLTADALLHMETEHPPLAIALHRMLAAQIGRRAERVEELTKILQR